MPDWLSHILIGLVICEISRIRKKSLVLLGALLPDLINKISFLGLFFPINFPIYSVEVFHTPIVCFLLAIIMAPLFKFNQKKVLLFVSIGLFSHFFFDIFTKHFLGGIILLFPFSWQRFRIDLFWFEQYYFILIPVLALYTFILIFKKLRSKKLECMKQ